VSNNHLTVPKGIATVLGFCFCFCFLEVDMYGKSHFDSPQMPFAFVENAGQADQSARYIGAGPEFGALFEDRAVVLRHGRAAVRVSFEGGSATTLTPENALGAAANYIKGGDPRRWHTGLPLYGALRYAGVWPGIEVRYEAERSRVKAEYTVAPGASAGSIRLRFDADAAVQSDGSLRIGSISGDFVEDRPLLYQVIRGERITIAGGFLRHPDGSIGFQVGDYDKHLPLVIDPAILFSGYFGGSGQDNISGVATDSNNNVIVTGWTSSVDLPATGGFQMRYGGSVDAFVASFSAIGGTLNYCTFIGGSGEDQATGIAVDSAGSPYITGWTTSSNFPVVGGFQRKLSGTRDAFVTKLSPAGNALVYSSYLGGSAVDSGYGIAVNSSNSAVVVGDTTSTNLATVSPIQPHSGGGQDTFMAIVNPAGSALTVLTYFGGSGIDHASCVHVGPQGGIVFGGYTWSTNFPTVSPFQAKSGGGQDGFVIKVSPTGTVVKLSTYLGGSGGSTGAPEQVNSISIDPGGNVIVAGTTSSADFPVTPGAFQTTFGGQTDGFVARYSQAGLQATFVGGSLADTISAVALDFHGNVYVTGSTDSQDFPVQNPTQRGNGGSMDAFAVKMNNTLSTLMFGTYLGGSGSDGANAIAVDFETSVIVAGQTSSGNFPTAGSMKNYSTEVLSSFITKIAPNFTAGVAYPVQTALTVATDPWHVANYVQSTVFGNSTDLPITGDWTGSGVRRLGIFRNGTWILDTNGNGVIDAADKTVVFGQAGDVPVVGDWVGTGKIALGLFRAGTFILDLSGHLSGVPTGQADATFSFGQGGDKPVVGDWNISGTAKVGIFRNGLWLVDYTGSRVYASARSYVYGQAGDLPVVGDWDSSGTASKIGVYRSGLWVLDYDGDNTWTTPYTNELVIGFGIAGYTPLIF
jgi:Beta-propeller repeat